MTKAEATIIAESSKTLSDNFNLLSEKLFFIVKSKYKCFLWKHGSKNLSSKLNLKVKMAENKLENLEKEVKELIKLSQQLKEVNDHLSKKNILLSKENNQLTQNLDVAKEGISKIIKSYKS